MRGAVNRRDGRPVISLSRIFSGEPMTVGGLGRTSSGFVTGFRVGRRPSGSAEDGVRDHPWCRGKDNTHGVASPVEMVVWVGEKSRYPHEKFKANDLSGE
jgi:hypothetical protein